MCFLWDKGNYSTRVISSLVWSSSPCSGTQGESRHQHPALNSTEGPAHNAISRDAAQPVQPAVGPWGPSNPTVTNHAEALGFPPGDSVKFKF